MVIALCSHLVGHHRHQLHMCVHVCHYGYLDASYLRQMGVMRRQMGVMYMTTPLVRMKNAYSCVNKVLMHIIDTSKFGHNSDSCKSLCLKEAFPHDLQDCWYSEHKSSRQTDAFFSKCACVFNGQYKASMHMDASIVGPLITVCKSLKRTEASNCGMVQTLRPPEHVVNINEKPMLEPSILEVMSLEEAIAMLDCKTHHVSVKGFIYILQLCRRRKNLDYLKQVHKHIQGHELEVHKVIGNYLVPTFVECGSLHDADQLFQQLTYRNEYSWTALIQGYVDCGDSKHAFTLYRDMQKNGIHPNTYTFQSLLRGCVQLKSLEKGRKLHSETVEDGLEIHPFVASALVDMYAKCGSMQEAQDVFDELPSRDVVVWTALIGGYAEHGESVQALSCLELMQKEGIPPNTMTLVCSLKGCCSLGTIDKGQWLHANIAEESLEGDLFLGNALVDMYVKRDCIEDAIKVFESMPSRDVVSWTALIMGYAERGLGLEALLSLMRMRQEGVSPNDVTYICSVKACGGSGSVDIGRRVHAQALKEGFDRHPAVGNALVDMYAKCGSLLEASETFNKLNVQDLVSWSALIAGYAHKGYSNIAFGLFERMKDEGIKPDSVVLLGILNACSHAGLVLKGKHFFETMEKEYGIPPTVEHYNCILDLLGRAGQIKDALEWLEEMPVKPNFVSWSTLLGACQNWCNVELGRRAFDCAVRLDKTQITSYIVMSSIYLDAGMWYDAKEIDVMRANLLA